MESACKWPEITEDTPLEEVKRIHQQIWDYVIEHGRKPDTPYFSNCAACEYAYKIYVYKIAKEDIPCFKCDHCPIAWSGEKCKNSGSLFDQWDKAIREGCYGLADKTAKQIRDMPFKFESSESNRDKMGWTKSIEVEFLNGDSLSMSSFRYIREGVNCLALYYGSESETVVDIPMKNIKSYRITYKRGT